MEPPTYLANKYHHNATLTYILMRVRIYTIDGDSDYMSVTTWNHSHFAHFDPTPSLKNDEIAKWPKQIFWTNSRRN